MGPESDAEAVENQARAYNVDITFGDNIASSSLATASFIQAMQVGLLKK